jgi:DNA mismatch endonuclease (patch repair protein)
MAGPGRARRYESLREFVGVAEPTQKVMHGNRAHDTTPELALRRVLWAAGLRGYRKNFVGLPGKPDMVFLRKRVCLFVHGCFWHGCERCFGARRPQRNARYWSWKIEGNRQRDASVVQKLLDLGWTSVVLWECELRTEPAAAIVDRVRAALNEALTLGR